MTSPRIAVVIACYNDGLLLREAYASIVENEPIEVVIVDDGSTNEETAIALDELKAAGVTVIHQANGGPCAAIATAVANSTAPYVLPLAADDHLEPGCLGPLADVLEQCGDDVAFVFGHAYLFGDVNYFRRTPDWNPWLLLYSNFWSATNLFRRDSYLAAGGFQPRTRYEDWDLFLGFAERGWRGVLVDRVVFHYRIHGSGRLRAKAMANFRNEYRALRSFHRPLYARRRELARQYRPSAVQRVFYPVQLAAGLYLPRQVVPFVHGVKLKAIELLDGKRS